MPTNTGGGGAGGGRPLTGPDGWHMLRDAVNRTLPTNLKAARLIRADTARKLRRLRRLA